MAQTVNYKLQAAIDYSDVNILANQETYRSDVGSNFQQTHWSVSTRIALCIRPLLILFVLIYSAVYMILPLLVCPLDQIALHGPLLVGMIM